MKHFDFKALADDAKGETYWRERIEIEVEEAVLNERRRCAMHLSHRTGMSRDEALELLGGMSCDASDYMERGGDDAE